MPVSSKESFSQLTNQSGIYWVLPVSCFLTRLPSWRDLGILPHSAPPNTVTHRYGSLPGSWLQLHLRVIGGALKSDVQALSQTDEVRISGVGPTLQSFVGSPRAHTTHLHWLLPSIWSLRYAHLAFLSLFSSSCLVCCPLFLYSQPSCIIPF